MRTSRRRSSNRTRRRSVGLVGGAVAGASLLAGVVLLRPESRQQPAGDSARVQPATSPRTDFRGVGDPGAPRAAPPSPEEIAREVSGAITTWRTAILQRDADTVVKLDAMFRQAPERYADALVDAAESDPDPRVRAFCTRVLGKLERPELADVFNKLLRDASPYVRQNAAWALGQLSQATDGRNAGRSSWAALRRLGAGDPDPDVRSAARSALESLR